MHETIVTLGAEISATDAPWNPLMTIAFGGFTLIAIGCAVILLGFGIATCVRGLKRR